MQHRTADELAAGLDEILRSPAAQGTVDLIVRRPAEDEREVLEDGVLDLEEGKRLLLGVQSVSGADERGIRTVMCTINGQFRPVSVRDRSISSDVPAQEKADTGNPAHVAAPFDGVVTVAVEAGAQVGAGDTVATIEAMKMEASITAPVAGTVERLAFDGTRQVEGGDLVLVLKSD